MEKINFIENTHEYYIGDKRIPCVSELLEFLNPTKYSFIDRETLDNAAERGTNVHKAIQQSEAKEFFLLEDETEMEMFNGYQELKEKYNLKPLEQEKKVAYKELYAGTFDMIGSIDDKQYLIDIKTTSILDEESLSWQLSLYELAYKDYYNQAKNFDGLKAIWLKKDGTAELVPIKRKSKKELLELINNFYTKSPDSNIQEIPYNDIFNHYVLNKRAEKLIKDINKADDAKVKDIIRENNLNSFECDYGKVTFTPAKEKDTIDSEKLIELFEKENPEVLEKAKVVKTTYDNEILKNLDEKLYNKAIKKVMSSERITVTPNKKTKELDIGVITNLLYNKGNKKIGE